MMLGNLRKTALWLSEYIELPRMDDAFMQSHVRFYPNKKTHETILRQGCLLIMGHLGLLEYSARAIQFCTAGEPPLYSLVRRTRNPYAEKMVANLRKACGVEILYNDNDGNVRKLIQLLRQGAVVAMPADQDAGPKGPFMPFLGKPASTFLGPAFIARKSSAPIYFYYNWHTLTGHFCCALEKIERPPPPLSSTKNHTHAKREWEMEFTKIWAASLEKAIRKHVTDYFWLHQRWRHQPPPAAPASPAHHQQ